MSKTRKKLTNNELTTLYDTVVENARRDIAAFLKMDKLTEPFVEIDLKITTPEMKAKIVWNLIYKFNQIKESPLSEIKDIIAKRKDHPFITSLKYIELNVRINNKLPFMPAVISLFELAEAYTKQLIDLFLGWSAVAVRGALSVAATAKWIPTSDINELAKPKISNLFIMYYAIEDIFNHSKMGLTSLEPLVQTLTLEQIAEKAERFEQTISKINPALHTTKFSISEETLDNEALVRETTIAELTDEISKLKADLIDKSNKASHRSEKIEAQSATVIEEIAQVKEKTTQAIVNTLDTVDLVDTVANIQMEAYQDISCNSSLSMPAQEKLNSFNTFKKHKNRNDSSSSSSSESSEPLDMQEYPATFKSASRKSKKMDADAFAIHFDNLRSETEKLLLASNQLLHASNQHPFNHSQENDQLLSDCQNKIRSLEIDIRTLENLAKKHEHQTTEVESAIAQYIEQSIARAQDNCLSYKNKVTLPDQKLAADALTERKKKANTCRDMINNYYKKRCQDYKHYDNIAKVGVFFAQCFKPGYETDREEIKQFLLKFDEALKSYVSNGDSKKINDLISEGRRSCQSRTSDKNDPVYCASRQYLFDQIEKVIGSQQPAVVIVPSM